MARDFLTYPDSKGRWMAAGIAALVVIILSFPLALVKYSYFKAADKSDQDYGPLFVGAAECKDCHRPEWDKWQQSHHEKAMDTASPDSVLGDFNNAGFTYKGVTSRFYKKEDGFFVHTMGPDGTMAEFEITHTFGFHPLQQYLIPFPGGRLQCLTIAWDNIKRQWYALPNHTNDHGDWLHWTRGAQNWNGMCAECHSTKLRKGYDLESDAFNTTWSEINVSCEACHGPGSDHVAWARQPAMARTRAPNYNLAVRTRDLEADQFIRICARCHSRRTSIDDFSHSDARMMDYIIPSLLDPGLYHADGQILDEVYVYGSFIQSKMYQRGIRCSDCHDVHSLELKQEGNQLCLTCHRADIYDTPDHHFHKKIHEGKESKGDDCINCHMPEQVYMGIDKRADHSIRMPMPDLTRDIGTPNSCSAAGCHADKDLNWTLDHMGKWYGKRKRSHFGPVIHSARQGDPQVLPRLIELAQDGLLPSIVRATAFSLLSGYPEEAGFKALEKGLMDEDALVRQTAISAINLSHMDKDARLIFPLLHDPVKAVRIQAALAVASIQGLTLTPDQQKTLDQAIEEYFDAMSYAGDFPSGRYNMGLMYSALGENDKALKRYEQSLAIDDHFIPAQNNLAVLYNAAGQNEKAERLLRQILEQAPEMYEIAYSLGLLLAEEKKYAESLVYLEQAAKGMPRHSRAHYNHGLLLQLLNKMPEAEAALLKALSIEPKSLDYLFALTDHFIKTRQFSQAVMTAGQMKKLYPNNRNVYDIIRYLDQIKGKTN